MIKMTWYGNGRVTLMMIVTFVMITKGSILMMIMIIVIIMITTVATIKMILTI